MMFCLSLYNLACAGNLFRPFTVVLWSWHIMRSTQRCSKYKSESKNTFSKYFIAMRLRPCMSINTVHVCNQGKQTCFHHANKQKNRRPVEL